MGIILSRGEAALINHGHPLTVHIIVMVRINLSLTVLPPPVYEHHSTKHYMLPWTDLGLWREYANCLCVLEPPSNTDTGALLDSCGDDKFCCHIDSDGQNSDGQNCCSLGHLFFFRSLSSRTTTVTSVVVITVASKPIDSTSTSSGKPSDTQSLSSSTTTTNRAFSSTKSSSGSTYSAPSPTSSNASTLDTLTQSTQIFVAVPGPTPTSGLTDSQSASPPAIQSSGPLPSVPASQSSSSVAVRSSSTLPSVSVSPSKSFPHKTALGLGIGLCLGVGLAFLGFILWFFRRKHRNRPRRKKLQISRPISVKAIPIPMFEVANTDWELPVDPHMPTELRANRSTTQSWF